MNVRGNMLSWIVVKNLKEAVKFYTEVVGLTLDVEAPEYGWAELTAPEGCRLGIAQESMDEQVKAGSNAIITITVEDLEKACSLYKEKGAKLIGEILEVPGHVKMQTFVDTDGNMMQIVQKMD
jgi:predicted enzyme related to lactoylglutathione lyase